MIRVGTWNIREGRGIADDCIFDPLVVCSQLNLDILGIQEVPFETRKRSSLVAAFRTQGLLPFAEMLAVHDSVFGSKHSGLVTLSKFPISQSKHSFFSAGGLEINVNGSRARAHDKAFTWTICSTSEGPVAIYNLHLFPFRRLGVKATDKRFAALWSTLMDELGQSVDMPTMLLGDFNTADRWLVIPSGLGYQRVVGNRETHEGFASDDIVVSKHFQILASELVANPSDHLLCVADLKL